MGKGTWVMSVQNFAQDETLYGVLVCRSCGAEREEAFQLRHLPFTCYACERNEIYPQLGINAERLEEVWTP